MLKGLGLLGALFSAWVAAGYLGEKFLPRFLRKRSSSPELLPDAADRPLLDPADDRLGYKRFASYLAEGLLGMDTPQGFVLGICGPWGAGKTTLLNFVESFLTQRASTTQPPIIIRFNPWWFSDEQDLASRLFDQLAAVLAKRRVLDRAQVRQLQQLGTALGANAPTPLLKPLSMLGYRPDLSRRKEALSDRLLESKRRIVVFIDDIDRLGVDGIRHMFALIKVVADFPNIIYVLAFDKKIVAKALDESGSSGESYLEKVIQTPFELPDPSQGSVENLLMERLTDLIRETPDRYWDQTHWANVFFDGIQGFLKTPRSAIRLSRTLELTYPPVRQEVNGVDFVALEALRLFSPKTYEIVRLNKEFFVGGNTSFGTQRNEIDEEQGFHQTWLRDLPESEASLASALLRRLFPRFDYSLRNQGFSAEGIESDWRRQRRIADPEAFDVFFRLALPEGAISTRELEEVVSYAHDESQLAEAFQSLAKQVRPDGRSRFSVFAEELINEIDARFAENVGRPIIRTFFRVGDSLLIETDDGGGFLGFGNDIRIGRIVWRIYRYYSEQDRYELLRSVVGSDGSLGLIVHELATLGQQHGKYGAETPRPEEERFLTSEHLAELEEIALQNIRKRARTPYLLKAPELPSILHRWSEWGQSKEVRRWVELNTSSDEGLIKFLSQFAQVTHSVGADDRTVRKMLRLDPEWLAPFIDVDEAIHRVDRLLEQSSVDEDTRRMLGQLLREKADRDKGRDPSLRWPDENDVT